MSIRVAYEEVKKNVKQAFLNLGLTEEQAETCATIHTQSSADGVESHGLNRIPRFVEYVQKGWINLEGKPQLVGAKGAVENYDGQLGIGITNALFCAERAAELAKEHGIGCVALKNTTHWMRGGTYAWKMAEAGFMGMSWINTESCAYKWLAETDINALPAGSYPIMGDTVVANIQEYTTIPADTGFFETHEKYFDIQYVAKGKEQFGICKRDGLKVKERIEENDLIFYEEPELSGTVLLEEGDMIIVAPEDAHKPRCQAGGPCFVKKVVVKVAL